MLQYNILFHRFKNKILSGIIKSKAGMDKTVQSVAGIRDMPVIKVKIMQHRTPDEAFIMKAYWKQERQAVAVISHDKAMSQCCGIPVLDELSHFQNLFLTQQFLEDADKFFFLCGSDGPHRLSLY